MTTHEQKTTNIEQNDTKVWKAALDTLTALHYRWREELEEVYPDLAFRAELSTLIHRDEDVSINTLLRLVSSSAVMAPPSIAQVLVIYNRLPAWIGQYVSSTDPEERERLCKEIEQIPGKIPHRESKTK